MHAALARGGNDAHPPGAASRGLIFFRIRFRLHSPLLLLRTTDEHQFSSSESRSSESASSHPA